MDTFAPSVYLVGSITSLMLGFPGKAHEGRFPTRYTSSPLLDMISNGLFYFPQSLEFYIVQSNHISSSITICFKSRIF